MNDKDVTKLTEFAPPAKEQSFLLSRIFRGGPQPPRKDASYENLVPPADMRMDKSSAAPIPAPPLQRHESPGTSPGSSPSQSSPSSPGMLIGLLKSSLGRKAGNEQRKYWMPDAEVFSCYDCDVPFTTFKRRHHCRICGQIFCSRCSENSIADYQGYDYPIRVCNYCYRLLHSGSGTDSPEYLRRERDITAAGGGLAVGDQISMMAGEGQGNGNSNNNNNHNANIGTNSNTNTPALHSSSSSGLLSSTMLLSPLFGTVPHHTNGTNKNPRSRTPSIVEVLPDPAPAYVSEDDDYADDDEDMDDDSPSGSSKSVSISPKPRPSSPLPLRSASPSPQHIPHETHSGRRLIENLFTGFTSSTGLDKEPSSSSSSSDGGHTDGTTGSGMPGEGAGPTLIGGYLATTAGPTLTDPNGIGSSGTQGLVVGPGPAHLSDASVRPLKSHPRLTNRQATWKDFMIPTKENQRSQTYEAQSVQKGSTETNEHLASLQDASAMLFAKFVRQLVHDESLGREWEGVVSGMAYRAVGNLRVDVARGDHMNICKYVKIKKIPGGTIQDCKYIDGFVLSKNVTNKHMRSNMDHPRVLLLSCPLEFQRVENRFLFFDHLINQERPYLKILVSKIAALRPDIVLVEKTVSRIAQDLLLDEGVTLVMNVKSHLMPRLGRILRADVLPTLDILPQPPSNTTPMSSPMVVRVERDRDNKTKDKVDANGTATKPMGTCDKFRVETFEGEWERVTSPDMELPYWDDEALPRQGAPRRTKKTLMFMEGCPRDQGCTLSLRGGTMDTLRKVKRVMLFAIMVAHSLRCETALFFDENATLVTPSTNEPGDPKAPLGPPPKRDLVEVSPSDRVQSMSVAVRLPPVPVLPPPAQSLIIPQMERIAPSPSRFISLHIPHKAGLLASFVVPHAHYEFDRYPSLLQAANDDDTATAAAASAQDKGDRGGHGHGHGHANRGTEGGGSGCTCNHPILCENLSPELLDPHHGDVYANPYVPPLSPKASLHHHDALSQDGGPSPYDSQNFVYVHSLLCSNTSTQCIPYEMQAVSYYSDNDITVGEFLMRFCFATDFKCPGKECARDLQQHERSFIHGAGRLNVSVERVSFSLPTAEEGPPDAPQPTGIFVWSLCRICKTVTPLLPMSRLAYNYSFGKFLEVSFYSFDPSCRIDGCPHSIHRDHTRYFSWGSLVAQFVYEPMEVLAACMPSLTLTHDPSMQRKLREKEIALMVTCAEQGYDAMAAKLGLLYDNYASILNLPLQQHQPTPAPTPAPTTNLSASTSALSSSHSSVTYVPGAASEAQPIAEPLLSSSVPVSSALSPSSYLSASFTGSAVQSPQPPRDTAAGSTGTDTSSMAHGIAKQITNLQHSLKEEKKVFLARLQQLQDAASKPHGISPSTSTPVPSPAPSATPSGEEGSDPNTSSGDEERNTDTEREKDHDTGGDELKDLSRLLYASFVTWNSTLNELVKSIDHSQSNARAQPPPKPDKMKGKPPPGAVPPAHIHTPTPTPTQTPTPTPTPTPIPTPSSSVSSTPLTPAGSSFPSSMTTAGTLTLSPGVTHTDPTVPTITLTSNGSSNSLSNILVSSPPAVSPSSSSPTGSQTNIVAPPLSSSSSAPAAVPQVASSAPLAASTKQNKILSTLTNLMATITSSRLLDPTIPFLFLPQDGDGGQGHVVALYEGEPSSIIAYTLNSSEFGDNFRAILAKLDTPTAGGSGQTSYEDLTSTINDANAPSPLSASAGPAPTGEAPSFLSASGRNQAAGARTRARSPSVSPSSTVTNASVGPPSLSPVPPPHPLSTDGPSDLNHKEVQSAPPSLDTSRSAPVSDPQSNASMDAQLQAAAVVDRNLMYAKHLACTERHDIRNKFTYEKHGYEVMMNCISYYPLQFKALRELSAGGDDKFIESLSRCKGWEADGGKSGSTFLKTLDDRFILKGVSRIELDSFLEFAPLYFEYLCRAFFHPSTQPTALGKIYGVYSIRWKSSTGMSMKENLIVMENLFYNRNISQIYDLKGSLRGRLVRNPNADAVLLDENLLQRSYTDPICMPEHGKTALGQAVWNDTAFLASLNVMDYSLLVGVDSQSKQLVVGIIDYMRCFTWDKQVEMWVKSSGIMGGRGKIPTVISPKQYKLRFRDAMWMYFVIAPTKHTNVLHPNPHRAEQEAKASLEMFEKFNLL
eukprot:TRINITY_DN2601_c0_g1_i3.p1 TRINITY_DN2601_c0_g1~~TRINITY_DN2601_c0_g1_i3.p1  ORF type:complete len:2157 (+),score=555.75 TRINITY_DN2601_c0_g1_i3:83-6553(+)